MKAIKGIDIASIDRDNCYWNGGCAMKIDNPSAADKILEILNKHFKSVKMHNICCQHDPKVPIGATIINNCAGCDRRWRGEYEGIKTISLWEVLDSIEDLELPDHTGLTVSIHDSCSYRERPDEQRALRSILTKMGIKIIESEFSGPNAICCGDSAYGKVPVERLFELQKKRAEQMPCQDVVVQCIGCTKSMAIGGKRPHYLPYLLLDLELCKVDVDMVKYHDDLQEYIDLH